MYFSRAAGFIMLNGLPFFILCYTKINFQMNKGQLQQIIDLSHELKGMKLLKWHQEFVLFMAVQMAIYDMAKVQQSLSMAIMSSIELLIQAQQAAMISAMTAAAVASNSSTS